jgi:hypothetical protein
MTSVTWLISKNSNQVTKVLEAKIDSSFPRKRLIKKKPEQTSLNFTGLLNNSHYECTAVVSAPPQVD